MHYYFAPIFTADSGQRDPGEMTDNGLVAYDLVAPNVSLPICDADHARFVVVSPSPLDVSGWTEKTWAQVVALYPQLGG